MRDYIQKGLRPRSGGLSLSLNRKIACSIAAMGLFYLAYWMGAIGFAPQGGRVSYRFVAGAGLCGFLGAYLIYDAWLRDLLRR